jgi:hypothetical protein
MTELQLHHENNRCTDDIEIVLTSPDGEQRAMSFVATVPHGCASPSIFGDLFDCRLEDIDYETVPVARGSQREAGIISRLRAYAATAMTPDEQNTLRHGKFPSMTRIMVNHRTILWLIDALEERSRRDDAKLEPTA